MHPAHHGWDHMGGCEVEIVALPNPVMLSIAPGINNVVFLNGKAVRILLFNLRYRNVRVLYAHVFIYSPYPNPPASSRILSVNYSLNTTKKRKPNKVVLKLIGYSCISSPASVPVPIHHRPKKALPSFKRPSEDEFWQA